MNELAYVRIVPVLFSFHYNNVEEVLTYILRTIPLTGILLAHSCVFRVWDGRSINQTKPSWIDDVRPTDGCLRRVSCHSLTKNDTFYILPIIKLGYRADVHIVPSCRPRRSGGPQWRLGNRHLRCESFKHSCQTRPQLIFLNLTTYHNHRINSQQNCKQFGEVL